MAAQHNANKAAKSLALSTEAVGNLRKKLLHQSGTEMPIELKWTLYFPYREAQLEHVNDSLVLKYKDVTYPIDPVFYTGSVWDVCKFTRAIMYTARAEQAIVSLARLERVRKSHEDAKRCELNKIEDDYKKSLHRLDRIWNRNIENNQRQINLMQNIIARNTTYTHALKGN